VIGVGSMGRNHARVYSELKGVGDLFVYDPISSNAERVKDYATICRSLDELLGCVEAVSICVPTKYHFQVAREVAKRSIACLIEKPITLDLDEGERLVELLRQKELVSGVGHIERFNPVVEEVKRIAERPSYLEIKRHNPTSSRITDASVVADLMIHDIDIVLNVLFKGLKAERIFSAGDENVCQAMMVYPGSVVSLSASRMSSKKIRTIYLEEDLATIEGDFMAQEVYVYRKPEVYSSENERYRQENIIEKVLVNKVEPLKVELRAFIDAVAGGTPFPVTPEEGLNNLRICREIEKGLA